ncbi:MAK10-like protein [Tanacetum coccineum]
MGDENLIRTLGDYSKPSHEGYRNTIELPEGNNVVLLRSDTIQLVQNGCSFHGLRSEDPIQHLKDFLKLMDPLDLDGEIPAKIEDPGLFTLPCRLSESKPFDTLADLGSCVNIIPLYLFKKLNNRLLKETDHIFGLADGTKSYPVRIVKDVEVHIEKLKLLNDFYVIDMKKDPETPLLIGRGFIATANAIIDCRIAKIAVGEGITRKDFLDCHLAGEWEISRDAELNPFKDTLVFRRMVEFLGAIPINLKCNMWESEGLIKKPINWDKPPKNKDGAWHAKIRLIDPDREEFIKTLQSIPTTRKLSERESPREIIDLEHFYDT